VLVLSAMLFVENKMEDQIEKLEIDNSYDWPITGFNRFAILFAGVLFPPFVFCYGDIFKPDWQGSIFECYACLSLTPPATQPFWPLILYSMLCMVSVLWNSKASKFVVIRTGLYMGVLWSLHFIILMAFALGGTQDYFLGYETSTVVDWVLVLIFGLLVSLSTYYILNFFRNEKLKTPWYRNLLVYVAALFLCVFVICVLCMIFIGPVMGEMPPMTIIMAPLVSAPFWCFTAYLFMSGHAFRSHQNDKPNILPKLAVALGNLSYYTMACFVSYSTIQKIYATLPKEKPDCYIATAAARGHRGFVGSEDVLFAGGEVMRVNSQLRRLKCGEHMLKTALPWVHWFFRLVYNAVGPWLARCLVWAVLADVTYILLKPVEWVVCGVLFVLYGKKCDAASKFYVGVRGD
jgi:hypothetical protein